MKNLHTLGIACLVLLFLSCKKQNADVKPIDKTGQRESFRIPSPICYDVQKTDGNYAGTSNERNNFSLRYFPNSSCGKTPLIIAIHGGGFFKGNKDQMLPGNLNQTTNLTNFKPLLSETELSDERIAYATINYRFISDNGDHLEAPLNDCKAFLTYIRNHALEYNIDPDRIILMGFSAGGSSALWVGLQDPAIKGIIAFSPQASLNILRWQPDIYTPYGVNKIDEINNYAFLAKSYYGTSDRSQVQEYSNIHKLHLLDLIDSSDPELFLATGIEGDLQHDAYQLYALRRKAQKVGIPVRIAYTRSPNFLDPNAETIIQFCLRKF